MSSKRRKMGNLKYKFSGFTLIETVIALGILAVIIGVIVFLLADAAGYGTFINKELETRQRINQTFQEMVSEVRSLNPSNIGGYPIAEAAADKVIFYSDYDADGLFERIRYFTSGSILKKGVIKPSGNPLVYDEDDEEISDMVENLVLPSAVFLYYGKDYSGAESPLSFPVDVAAIRVIKITIGAKTENQNVPVTQTLFLTPRNLRSDI